MNRVKQTAIENPLAGQIWLFISFTAKIAGPCWVFWTFWANTSSEPITQWDPYYYYSTVTRFAEFCRVRDTKLQTQSPLESLNMLNELWGFVFQAISQSKIWFFLLPCCWLLWKHLGKTWLILGLPTTSSIVPLRIRGTRQWRSVYFL